jgi:hypothetical protein
VTFSGTIRPAKKGVLIERQRYVAPNWTTQGSTATLVDGSWSMKVLLPTAGTYTYRIRVMAGDQVITMSHARVVTAKKVTAKPGVTLNIATTSRVGKPLKLSGKAAGVGSGATVQRQRLVNGVWQNLGTAAVSATGAWSMTVTPPKAANYTYRIALLVSGKVVALSKTVTVKVVA